MLNFPDGLSENLTFVALVTFERLDDDSDIEETLPKEAQGACGWMAVAARDEIEAADFLRRSLRADGLKLLEAEDFRVVFDLEAVHQIDEHLASNMERWELEKRTVWGTIYVYLADDEA